MKEIKILFTLRYFCKLPITIYIDSLKAVIPVSLSVIQEEKTSYFQRVGSTLRGPALAVEKKITCVLPNFEKLLIDECAEPITPITHVIRDC